MSSYGTHNDNKSHFYFCTFTTKMFNQLSKNYPKKIANYNNNTNEHLLDINRKIFWWENLAAARNLGISFQTPMAQHTRRIQLFSLLPRFRASSSSTLPLFLLTCICRFLLLFQRSEGVVHLRIRRTLGFCFWLSFSLWLACYSGRLSWDSIFSPAISGFRCRLRCRCCGSPYSVGHLRRAMPNYQRYSRRICLDAYKVIGLNPTTTQKKG